MIIPSQFSKLDYCQFLLSSQINYTLTYFAEHVDSLSHDLINRYLKGERLRPRFLWEQVCQDVVLSPNGYLIFDDTVLDKRFSSKIEATRRQWSGNAKKVLRGIGVVTAVYVNPESGQFWVIDYRIFDPETDGKTKLQHAHDMLRLAYQIRQLPFRAVLMDTWYASKWFMRIIEQIGKVYYCPIRCNRNCTVTAEAHKYLRADALDWTPKEYTCGKVVHLKDFPQGHRVTLFRLERSTSSTKPDVEFVVTNDRTHPTAQAVQDATGWRWKIEEAHRETKQLTGIEACQCRLNRIQRNHIACALLVRNHLKTLAMKVGTTMYQLKHGLLDDYMKEQLRNPTIRMEFA